MPTRSRAAASCSRGLACSRHSRCSAGSRLKHPTCPTRQMRPMSSRQSPRCCSARASATISSPLAVFAALLLLTAWAQRGRFATVGLTGLALALQAGHSHAFAMEHGPSLLLYAEGLHLPAGGAWLGGLLPLLILVRDAPPKPAAEALRRFSKLATLCVLAIAGTACFQGWVLGGGVAGLIGTPLWLGASPQGGALCPPARACGHQPLSPHSGAAAPRRTAGKRSAHAHHSSGDRAWADGGACRRRAERP